METHRATYRALLVIVVAIIAAAAILRPGAASAHHGQPPETVAMQTARDAAAVRKCDTFTFEQASPSKAVCQALLEATHRVKVPNRKSADRTWIYRPALLTLLKRESTFRTDRVNPSSGACGLGQMLPCAKFGPGTCWRAVQRQADCVIRYIIGRYRTPERAWDFWQNIAPCIGNRACRGPHWY